LAQIEQILKENSASSYEYEWYDEKVFSLTSLQFRDFVTVDSKDSHIHSRVNALSNIKRAIECRVDELLWYCCVMPIARKERWNFPSKLEVLGKIGILAPSILTRINQKRNQLEHQYVRPSQKDLRDGVDVMMLFLEYTVPFCSNIKRIRVLKGKRVACDIVFDQKHETITVRGRGKDVRVNISSCSTEDVVHFAKTLANFALGTQRLGPTLTSY
jgi:hypothetical protein